MDQAIYESTTQKIFGVRGQWLFQFNSLTGALEQSLRFTTNATSVSSIVALSGVLYVGTTYVIPTDWNAAHPLVDRDVFTINPLAFLVTGRWNYGNTLGGLTPGLTGGWGGWRYLVTDGTKIFGYEGSGTGLWSTLPATPIPSQATTGQLWMDDLTYDAFNNVLWLCDSDSPQIRCVSTDFLNSCNSGATPGPFFGVCYNTAQNKVYVVQGGESFLEFAATAAVPGFSNFTVNTKHTGRVNCNAVRIKSVNGLASNPLNGKVLIPTWADDAVVVWNPLTDTVDSVKTGFTAPFDIVSTPTKNWAVQTGLVGLKEIV